MSTPQDAPAVEDTGIEHIEIDLLVLADWAETINGKLYIQGGGWDRKVMPEPGQTFQLAIASGILVPWNMTNQRHQFTLVVETGDGTTMDTAVRGGFNVGRPPSAQPGQRFRAPFVAHIAMDPKKLKLGAYQVRLTVNNDIERIVAFYVVDKL